MSNTTSGNDTIDFYFDIGSPYAYMAATQLEGVAQRTGMAVRWKPFLLGAVFKAVGNTMPAQIQAKARWMFSDLTMWSEHYGVPFKLSSRFPLNTLKTQRALVAAQRIAGDAAVAPFARALFHAYWVDDLDVSEPAVIEELAGKAGLDGAAIAAALDAPETKDALRALTEEAVARGAFGAPALFVGGQLFWGNDRLPLLEAHVRRIREGEKR